jgi:DNA repair exonuclease SbcCD ATPase subunit
MNTFDDKFSCKICFNLAFTKSKPNFIICSNCHILYCKECFSILNNKCSSCKSSYYYNLDSKKSELQSLLSINQNEEHNQHEQNERNENLNKLKNIFGSILFNTTCLDEQKKKKHIEIYNKLRRSIIKKQNAIFKSSDTKLYNICQEIQSTLLKLSEIYTDIQTCYHKSHNYKEIDVLIKFENDLKEKENNLNQKENELKEKENNLNKFDIVLKEKENVLNNLKKFENELKEYEKQIDNEMNIEFKRRDKLVSDQKEILQQMENRLQKKEAELKTFELKLLESENMIYNDMEIISKENNTYDNINFVYYKIVNLLIFSNCIDSFEINRIEFMNNINKCKSELITLIQLYLTKFEKNEISKLIPNINLSEIYLIKSFAIKKFIGLSNHYIINQYLEELSKIHVNLSNMKITK